MADPKTYTEAEVQALVDEKLAAAKAEGDTAFQKLWGEAKAAKERARAFGDLDPEEAKGLKAKLAQVEQEATAAKAGITSQQLEKMRGEITADLEKQYAPMKTKLDSLSAENRTLKLDNVVKGVMAKNGVRAERVDALYRLTASEYDLTDDGKPMVKDRMGTPVEKYIAEDLSKQYPEFYSGTGSSGGGAPKPNAGGGGGVRQIAAPANGGILGKDFIDNLENVSKGTTVVG